MEVLSRWSSRTDAGLRERSFHEVPDTSGTALGGRAQLVG
jgi:hypothetical protein